MLSALLLVCRRRIRWDKLTIMGLRWPKRLPREFVGQTESVVCADPRLLRVPGLSVTFVALE